MKAINQSLLSHIQIFKERYSYRSKDQKSALNRLSLKRSFLNSLTLTATRESGGAKRDRTADLLRARQALSQLSYGPVFFCTKQLVGLGRFELPTSPLSGVRSNQLSYKPDRPRLYPWTLGSCAGRVRRLTASCGSRDASCGRQISSRPFTCNPLPNSQTRYPLIQALIVGLYQSPATPSLYETPMRGHRRRSV